MKVIIMCGGKGTRLREETSVKPKPMVEIGGRPVLWHIMSIYARFGFKDFILPLGYKGEVIKQYFHDYNIRNTDFTVDLKSGNITTYPNPIEDWRVTLCDTGQETQKGGRLKRVAKHIDTDRFMVTYGDGVADIDLNKLIEFHKQSGSIGTFTGVRMPSRFGTVRTDADGKILSSSSANFLTTSQRTKPAIWKKNPCNGLRRKGSFPCIRTPASGSAWTRCATPSSSTRCGTRARPSGSKRRFATLS